MARFTVVDRSPARFAGDFQVRRTGVPSWDEQAFLARLETVLAALANDEAADAAASHPRLVERGERRQAVAAALRTLADKFCAAGLTTQEAATVETIQKKYVGDLNASVASAASAAPAAPAAPVRATVSVAPAAPAASAAPAAPAVPAAPAGPRFTTADRTAPRLDGDFRIETGEGVTASPDEKAYVDKLEEVLRALASDEERDTAAKFPETLLAARRERRKAAAVELRREADEFCKGELDAGIAAGNAPVIRGKYLADSARLLGSLFTVIENIEGAFATGLRFRIAHDLPAPNNVPSPEKQELFVAIGAAESIIQIVCRRMENSSGGWLVGKSKLAEQRARAKPLLDEHMRKLAGIGRLGLEGPHTTLAKLALESVKNDFVAREADRIKNTYVRSLGAAAATAALLFLAAYVLIGRASTGESWWLIHRSFLLAGTGAAIGTWISFSIRQVQLPFERLAVLEEDLLDPSLRVLFVIALTTALCLLFWTGAINIEIGNLKTQPEEFRKAGTVALLIGIFGGLSERALATALSGRAAAFVRGVAG